MLERGNLYINVVEQITWSIIRLSQWCCEFLYWIWNEHKQLLVLLLQIFTYILALRDVSAWLLTAPTVSRMYRMLENRAEQH
jgi:hypothetical protein